MTDTLGRIEQLTQEVRRDLEFRHGMFATLSPEFERRVAEEVERRLAIPPFPDAWRCRTCRWWDQDGYCGRIQSVGSLARTVGGDFIGESELETDPDFGCVQWQARNGE